MISCVYNKDFRMDKPNEVDKLKYPSLNIITKLSDQKPLPFDITKKA